MEFHTFIMLKSIFEICYILDRGLIDLWGGAFIGGDVTVYYALHLHVARDSGDQRMNFNRPDHWCCKIILMCITSICV